MVRLPHSRGQRVAWADVPAQHREGIGTGSAAIAALAAQIIAATFSRPMMRASERTSLFWSSRNWNSSGIAADFNCWTSADLRIDRHARSRRVGLPARMNLAGDGAQRGFHGRPVGFLRGRQFQAVLDFGDLDVTQQRVILLWLRLRFGDGLGLRRRHRRCCAVASPAGATSFGIPISAGAVDA